MPVFVENANCEMALMNALGGDFVVVVSIMEQGHGIGSQRFCVLRGNICLMLELSLGNGTSLNIAFQIGIISFQNVCLTN